MGEGLNIIRGIIFLHQLNVGKRLLLAMCQMLKLFCAVTTEALEFPTFNVFFVDRVIK